MSLQIIGFYLLLVFCWFIYVMGSKDDFGRESKLNENNDISSK